MDGTDILFKLADKLTKILSLKSNNQRELFERQISPIYDGLKEHNESLLAISTELRNGMGIVVELIRSKPNTNEEIVRALKSAEARMAAALSEGQTDRSSIRNVSLEFSNFPFYSKPIFGWMDDEFRQQVMDYFDSVVSYFSYSGSSKHAMRHSLGVLRNTVRRVEEGSELNDLGDDIETMIRELDLAEKHLVDRWGIIAGKKARLEGSIFHG